MRENCLTASVHLAGVPPHRHNRSPQPVDPRGGCPQAACPSGYKIGRRTGPLPVDALLSFSLLSASTSVIHLRATLSCGNCSPNCRKSFRPSATASCCCCFFFLSRRLRSLRAFAGHPPSISRCTTGGWGRGSALLWNPHSLAVLKLVAHCSSLIHRRDKLLLKYAHVNSAMLLNNSPVQVWSLQPPWGPHRQNTGHCLGTGYPGKPRSCPCPRNTPCSGWGRLKQKRQCMLPTATWVVCLERTRNWGKTHLTETLTFQVTVYIQIIFCHFRLFHFQKVQSCFSRLCFFTATKGSSRLSFIVCYISLFSNPTWKQTFTLNCMPNKTGSAWIGDRIKAEMYL